MTSLMLKSVYAESDGKPMPILVDFGYWARPETVERWKQALEAGIGSRRFSIEGRSRLFCELPPTKSAALIERLPIVEGSTYWRATHHWRGLGEGETALSQADSVLEQGAQQIAAE